MSDTKGTHSFLNDFLVPSPQKPEEKAEEEKQESRKRNRSAWAFIESLEEDTDAD